MRVTVGAKPTWVFILTLLLVAAVRQAPASSLPDEARQTLFGIGVEQVGTQGTREHPLNFELLDHYLCHPCPGLADGRRVHGGILGVPPPVLASMHGVAWARTCAMVQSGSPPEPLFWPSLLAQASGRGLTLNVLAVHGPPGVQVDEVPAQVIGKIPEWLSGTLVVNGGGDYSGMWGHGVRASYFKPPAQSLQASASMATQGRNWYTQCRRQQNATDTPRRPPHAIAYCTSHDLLDILMTP